MVAVKNGSQQKENAGKNGDMMGLRSPMEKKSRCI
jgi:hypothetical protein